MFLRQIWWQIQMCMKLQYRRVPGRMMWMHASFCRELIVLPGACVWSLDTYFNLHVSPINNLYILFVERFCHQNNISCNFIYNANGIFFNPQEFYFSCLSAGNKFSVHNLSVFLPGTWQYGIYSMIYHLKYITMSGSWGKNSS